MELLPFNVLEAFGIENDSRLLIAVSGGPDSIALAHAALQLFREGHAAEVAIAHVNHRLRGKESDRDEKAVKEFCRDWNVNLYTKQFDTLAVAEENKTGIEETARKLRYGFFEDLISKFGFHFVLTAHTANDQAETVILNMMRGAGVRGLAGIPPKRKLGNGYVIRPWLNVTRNEITEYLFQNQLEAEHDTTNEELTFRRNQVRHKVIPALDKIWPDRSSAIVLSSLAARMRELSHFVDEATRDKLDHYALDGGLALEGVKSIDGFLFHALMEAWVQSEFGHYGLTSEESSRIEQWLNASSPRMELRRGLSLRKDGDVLRLESDGRY